MVLAQARRDGGDPLVSDLECLVSSPGEVEHVREIGVAVRHRVEVIHLPGDLDRPLHPRNSLVHLPKRDHRHPQGVERLGHGGWVIDLHRQREGLLGVPHGLPEAPAQKPGPGQPR